MTSPALQEEDVSELFRLLDTEITAKAGHLERLKKTLVTFTKASELFDPGNIAKISALCRRREDELLALTKEVTAAKELYTATVAGLEEKIRHKAALLQAVDQEFGTISAEEELLQYFAEDQVRLSTGIARVKHALVQKICANLGPTIGPTMAARSDM